MTPFPFFIPNDPVNQGISPVISDGKISDIAHVPCKTSRQVSEGDLYFGLDLDILSISKGKTKKL